VHLLIMCVDPNDLEHELDCIDATCLRVARIYIRDTCQIQT
jgi:hypothetical protein